jgi:hypothetical protein
VLPKGFVAIGGKPCSAHLLNEKCVIDVFMKEKLLLFFFLAIHPCSKLSNEKGKINSILHIQVTLILTGYNMHTEEHLNQTFIGSLGRHHGR